MRRLRRGGRVIPAVPMWRCDVCGDVVIGEEGNRQLDQEKSPPVRDRKRPPRESGFFRCITGWGLGVALGKRRHGFDRGGGSDGGFATGGVF